MIITENNTERKKYIHVLKKYYSIASFLTAYTQFGNDITNKTLSWADGKGYFIIRTNSYITDITDSAYFTIEKINDVTYSVTPKTENVPAEETVTISNKDGLSIAITMIYHLSVSDAMIELTVSDNTYYYDYFGVQSDRHYFNSKGEDIGNSLDGDEKTYYV